MNEEEIRNMEAGRELDTLVAEKVMISPGRTGVDHRMSRKPGDGPPCGLGPEPVSSAAGSCLPA